MKKIFMMMVMIGIFFTADYSYGQATAGQHNPYQNLGKWHIYNDDINWNGVLPPEYSWTNENDWYGTQSTPTSYEKAIWALDDINAYRAEEGLTTFPESILEAKISVLETENSRQNTTIIGQIIALLWTFIAGAYLGYALPKLMQILRDDCGWQGQPKQNNDINYSDICDAKDFYMIWQQMDEWRRRNNAGLFVQMLEREPTEHEFVTGEISHH